MKEHHSKISGTSVTIQAKTELYSQVLELGICSMVEVRKVDILAVRDL